MRSTAMPRFFSKIPGFILFSILNDCVVMHVNVRQMIFGKAL